MLCCAVIVDWVLLKPCCVEICGMLFVMYGSSVFSSVFAITERSEMGLYDVPMFMSLFGFGIGMMFTSFHVWGMMLLFCDMLYMWVQAVLCAWGAGCWLYQAMWSCFDTFVIIIIVSSNLYLPSIHAFSLLYRWNGWGHRMSRAVQGGCIASCVRYFLLPDSTHISKAYSNI